MKHRLIVMAGMMVLLLTVSSGSVAQQFIRTDDPAFREKYAQFQFGERFAVMIQSDGINNYYLLNLEKLPSRFMKVYFMDRSFSEPKIVNVDADINKSYLCFTSRMSNPEKEIIETFDRLLRETEKASLEMTENDRSDWLKKHDKYK